MQLKRIQRKRTKGWRMPGNTVSVCRPGLYGNPYRVGVDGNAEECVKRFRSDIEDGTIIEHLGKNFSKHNIRTVEEWLSPLKGKNLACWCAEGNHCHGEVLLEIANSR